jgi:diguanylate cyclase (GGDEF)-like protein
MIDSVTKRELQSAPAAPASSGIAIPRAASIIAILTGCLTLAGWGFHIGIIRSLLPGSAPMAPATALAFIVLAGSLWISAARPTGRRRHVARAGGAAVALIGLLQLLELFGWPTGVDRLLVPDVADVVAAGPNRMAASAALNFLLLGGALLLLDRETGRGHYVSQLLVVAAVLGSLLPVLGYLYDIESLYGLGTPIPMALPTAMIFLALAFGFLFASPERGLASLIRDDGVAGVTARRLLPAAIIIPASLGWLTLKAARLGLPGVDLDVMLLVVATTLVFTVLVWWNARLLRQIESQLDEARDLAIESAQHDFLTNLPNRLLLNDRLTHAIALARRHSRRLAVLFLDLDRFKQVNDSLGHPIGDALLQSIAQRLVTCVRSSDTVGRQGGDEFVVLLTEINQAEDVAGRAQRIIAALTEPHVVAQHRLRVTVTIGISMYPDDGSDAQGLIERADTAMYRAKGSGKNDYQFFERGMDSAIRAKAPSRPGPEPVPVPRSLSRTKVLVVGLLLAAWGARRVRTLKRRAQAQGEEPPVEQDGRRPRKWRPWSGWLGMSSTPGASAGSAQLSWTEPAARRAGAPVVERTYTGDAEPPHHDQPSRDRPPDID